MSDQTFGQSVSAAFEFLYEFCGDLKSLFETFKVQMDGAGWQEWYPLRIKPDSPSYLYFGMYAPQTALGKKTFTHAILLQLQISAGEFIEEPTLLAAVIDFQSATDLTDVWNKWNRKGGRRAMQFALKNGSPIALPETVLKNRFVPAGKRAVGITVPVCTLRDAADVQSRLTKPIISAANDLGFKME
jgi:hypothetical protein